MKYKLDPVAEQDDWYQDEDGVIWEYGFDIDINKHRWCEIDPNICGLPRGRRIEPPSKPESDG